MLPKSLEVFQKQLEKNKLSHAYLLIGDNTLETAQMMAQSLVCESDNVPCGVCSNCVRIQDNTYYDYVLVDGSKESIKKDDILDIQHKFSQTSLEEKPHRIYILEQVNNATTVALNSLLKFLEEPSPNIYAILTAPSENTVLETIQSRCMILTLDPVSKEKLNQQLVADGLDTFDAYILSVLLNDKEEALQLSETKEYLALRNLIHDSLSYINKEKITEALINLQVVVSKDKTIERDMFLYYCQVMVTILLENKDDLVKGIDDETRYRLIKTFTKTKDTLRPGFNLGLVVDGLVYDVLYGA